MLWAILGIAVSITLMGTAFPVVRSIFVGVAVALLDRRRYFARGVITVTATRPRLLDGKLLENDVGDFDVGELAAEENARL